MAHVKKTAARRRNLLIELGTEELPPKALKILSETFGETFFNGLVEAGMVQNLAEKFKCYATPRRLAVWVQGVLPNQLDREEQRLGPAIQAAFDDKGNPTQAAAGFAKSCGVDVTKLKKVNTDKGERLAYSHNVKGAKLNAIVSVCLEAAVKSLPIPKRMRWGNEENEFVRPVHWLLALYGSDLVKTEILGLISNRLSRGHRFHCPGDLLIASADRYVDTLKNTGYVIADYESRKCLIEKQVHRLATKSGNLAVIDPSLLNEVTGLVEWPVALIGEYDEQFLKLPKEVLISTMADHQKYFFLTNAKGKLAPGFIAVSNIKSKTPKRVRQGNERVLRARLADAEFFWKTDQKQTLDQRVDDLKGVLFHFKLGSIYDKSIRIQKLAVNIANQLEINADKTVLAAKLCKTDLVSNMVGEFPDLQGIIGKYYALNEGIDKEVANAVDEHYMPRFSGDKLPGYGVSKCVAIADRLDSLVGIFICGEIPSGDKDPFALRRASLGILRIMIEGKLDLNLKQLTRVSLQEYKSSGLENINISDDIVDQVFDYVMERLRGYFQSQNIGADIYAAVASCNPSSPVDFSKRVRALEQFLSKRKVAAESLASANKRIANILSKASLESSVNFKKKLIVEDAERELSSLVSSISKQVQADFKTGDYARGLESLASLKAPVDSFFDEVMVMHDNPEIKANRLALLREIRNLFLGVADISKVRTEGISA